MFHEMPLKLYFMKFSEIKVAVYPCLYTYKVNPSHGNVPFLYPLKTSGNQRFSDVFRGYRNGTWREIG